MKQDYVANLELESAILEVRAKALGHACHDERGNSSAKEVVARAAVYAKFLIEGK